ncbi:hypothetical protein ACFE04_001177 [Oxalis oulophora]
MLPKVVQGRNTGPSGRGRVRPSLYLNLPEHMLEDKVVHSASKIDHTTKHTSHLQKRKKIDVTDDNEEFEKTYCPEDHKKNGYKKLMKLVQGPTPIAEYVERFTELTQMVPDLTEKDKCERFKQGLKVAIKKDMLEGRPKKGGKPKVHYLKVKEGINQIQTMKSAYNGNCGTNSRKLLQMPREARGSAQEEDNNLSQLAKVFDITQQNAQVNPVMLTCLAYTTPEQGSKCHSDKRFFRSLSSKLDKRM